MSGAAFTTILGASLIVSAAAVRAQDKWETLAIGTNAMRNVSVVQSTPVEVIFKHEGGYLRMKRQELPDALKARFPYDAQRAEIYLKRQEQAKQLEALNNREALARQRIQSLEQKQEKVREDMRKYRGKKGSVDKGRMANFDYQVQQHEKEKVLVQNELNTAILARTELQAQMAATPPVPPEPTPAAAAPATAPTNDATSPAKAPSKKKKKKQ